MQYYTLAGVMLCSAKPHLTTSSKQQYFAQHCSCLWHASSAITRMTASKQLQYFVQCFTQAESDACSTLHSTSHDLSHTAAVLCTVFVPGHSQPAALLLHNSPSAVANQLQYFAPCLTLLQAASCSTVYNTPHERTTWLRRFIQCFVRLLSAGS